MKKSTGNSLSGKINFVSSVVLLFLFPFIINSSFSQGKFELNVAISYDIPKYEAYGDNVVYTSGNDIIMIDGKRLLNSDNLGTTHGYGIQVSGNMRLFKQDYVKLLGNIAFVQLVSKHPEPNTDNFIGVRMYLFSIGGGLQVNPVGIHKFYPSLIGLFRFNEVGGESYHLAGLDFLVATPRFGISAGFDLNYKFNKKIGISLGMRYSYDNMFNKQTAEGTYNDAHVINFRDAMSPTNGLSNDRRIVYIGILSGINIYFK